MSKTIGVKLKVLLSPQQLTTSLSLFIIEDSLLFPKQLHVNQSKINKLLVVGRIIFLLRMKQKSSIPWKRKSTNIKMD